MSEPAPERPAAPAPARGGNALTKKVGPLPVWGWAGLGVIGGLVFLWIRNRSANAAAASTAADTTGSGTAGTDFAGQIATLQSEIQQLQGEPSTPGPAGPAGPRGPRGKPGESSDSSSSDMHGGGNDGGGNGHGKTGGPPFNEPPPAKTGATRHVSTGRESLAAIARAAGTSVPHLIAVAQQSPENKENLAKLIAWANHPGQKRKGIVYYLPNA